VYLKDHSPYPDSSLFVVNLRIQLELICWATTPPELNYDIYNKELLGIVTALKKWRAFLQGTEKPFVVKIDYKNLTGFLTTKELN